MRKRNLLFSSINHHKKIAIIASYAPSILNFRKDLILAMQKIGCHITIIAPKSDPETTKKIIHLGCDYIPIQLFSRSLNPGRDLLFLWALFRIFRRLKPNYILSYTIKPVIWTGIAARFLKIDTSYGMITGLGYIFVEARTWKRKLLQILVKRLYTFSLVGHKKVFFQNPDDQELFVNLNLLFKKKTGLVNGSGVDLEYFAYSPLKTTSDDVIFLLIARLIKAKGIYEFVEAAQMVRKKYPRTRFQLVGWIEDHQPDAISSSDLKKWVENGDIEYRGRLEDVREAIQSASVYVLPSYREGTPRSVLEAMAIGRAIITTDVPGCRETVIKGGNGFLVPVQDSKSLAQAMEKFLKNRGLLKQMGEKSRALAEKKYNVHHVNQVILHKMGLIPPERSTG